MSLVVGLTPYCDIETVKGLVKPYGLPESNAFVQLSSTHDVELLSEHLLLENSSLIIVWSRLERLVETACIHHLALNESTKDWLLVNQSLDRLVRRHRKQIRLIDMGLSSNPFRWIAKSFLRENPAYYQIESRLLAMSVNLIEDPVMLPDARLEDLISFIADQRQLSVSYQETIDRLVKNAEDLKSENESSLAHLADENSRLAVELDTLKASIDEKNTQLKEAEQENSLIISELHRVQETLEETFKDKQKLLDDHDRVVDKVAHLTKEKEQALKNYEQVIHENTSVVRENERLQTNLSEQAKQLNLKSLEASQLSSDLDTLNKELMTVKADLVATNSRDKKNSTQLKDLEEENLLIISELHRVQEALEEAFVAKNTFHKEKEDLINKVEKLKRDFESLAKSKIYLERNLMLVKSDHAVKSPLQRFKKARQALKQAAVIESSGYFDAQWYLAQNTDIAEHKRFSKRPALHYLTIGGFEGRNPSPNFNSEAYLMANKDVLEQGFNPLMHFILHGKAEGRPLNKTLIADLS